MTLDELIDRYCRAWSDADPAARAAHLDAVWGAGATYTDPTVADLERDELLAHIARIQTTRPGAVVRRNSAIDAHHGSARFGFEVVGKDGAILRTGIDFVLLDAAGLRIVRIVGFFGDLAPMANDT